MSIAYNIKLHYKYIIFSLFTLHQPMLCTVNVSQ